MRIERYRAAVPAVAAALLLSILAVAGCSGGDKSADRAEKEQKSGPAPAADERDMSDVALTRLDGTRARISDYEGKILFVTFIATWHEKSLEIIPILERLDRKFHKNVEMLLVATDRQGRQAVRAFFANRDVDLEVFADGQAAANEFGGARELPTTYILHRDGKFFHRIDGLQRADKYESIILSMYRQHF